MDILDWQELKKVDFKSESRDKSGSGKWILFLFIVKSILVNSKKLSILHYSDLLVSNRLGSRYRSLLIVNSVERCAVGVMTISSSWCFNS